MIKFIKNCAFVAFCGIACMGTDAQAVSRRYLQEKCNKLMRQDPPKISVQYNYGVLAYNFDLSADDIKKTFSKMRDIDEASKTKYYGLTVLSSYNNVQIQPKQIEISFGYYCIYPEKIEISTGFNSPVTIYVAKELDKKSCRYRKTLLHEYHHLDVAYITMNAYLNALKKRLTEALISMNGKVIAQGERDSNSDYYHKIDSLYQFYIEQWNAESMKIDTKENYSKEAKICE